MSFAPLDELARGVVVRHVEAFRATVGDRWGKRRSALRDTARIYVAPRGGALLDVAGRRAALKTGEIAFLPRASSHVIRDRASTAIGSCTGACEGMRQVGPDVYESTVPPEAEFITVDLHLDAAFAPWRSLLPGLVHLTPGSMRVDAWLRETVALIADVQALSPALRGSIAIALAHGLFAHALRSTPILPGEALRDEPVAAALAQVRAAPEQRWELGELARSVGLSRSALAARTKSLLGEPLGAYVRRLRLTHGATLLATTSLPVKAIAARVGYESEPAFARAFARAYGHSPGAHRARRPAAASSVVAAIPPSLG